MIYGQIDKIGQYVEKEARLKGVVEFLLQNDLLNLPTGRHDINGQLLYVNIDEYTTQPFADRSYEIHQRYIDVQCILEGQESIFIEAEEGLQTKTPYDHDHDIAFLEDGINTTEVKMHANDFLVIYPKEAHKPCVQSDQSEYVKKAVFKIAIGEV